MNEGIKMNEGISLNTAMLSQAAAQNAKAPPDPLSAEKDFQKMYEQAVSTDGEQTVTATTANTMKTESAPDKSSSETQTDQADLAGTDEPKAEQNDVTAESLIAGLAEPMPIPANTETAQISLPAPQPINASTAVNAAAAPNGPAQGLEPLIDQAEAKTIQSVEPDAAQSGIPASSTAPNDLQTDAVAQKDSQAVRPQVIRPDAQAKTETAQLDPAGELPQLPKETINITSTANTESTVSPANTESIVSPANTKSIVNAESTDDAAKPVLSTAGKATDDRVSAPRMTDHVSETQEPKTAVPAGNETQQSSEQQKSLQPLTEQPMAAFQKPVKEAAETMSAAIQSSTSDVPVNGTSSIKGKKSGDTTAAAQSPEKVRTDVLPEQIPIPQAQPTQILQKAEKLEDPDATADVTDGTDSKVETDDVLALDAASKGASSKGSENSQAAVGTQTVTDTQAVAKEQTAPLPAYSQISDEILKQLAQKGPTQFQLSLQPADLGQIDIKLSLRNSKLIIDITAASSKTQSLLTNQVDNLITSMGLQNAKVEIVQTGNNTMTGQETLTNQTQTFSAGNGFDFSQSGQGGFLQKDNTGSLNRWAAAAVENANAAADDLTVSDLGTAHGAYLGRLDYSI